MVTLLEFMLGYAPFKRLMDADAFVALGCPLVVRLPTHSKWSHLPWGGLPSGLLQT